MLRELFDLVSFVFTEPINIAVKIIDDIVDKVDKTTSITSKPSNFSNSCEPSTKEPGFGSVIYCDLLYGGAEHSGIYVGNNQVVALNGDGEVIKVSLNEFTSHLTTISHEILVPICSSLNTSIHFPSAGYRALSMVGKSRNYHFLLDNCHQFVAGCLTQNFENSTNILWMLKDLVEAKHRGRIVWKTWDWKR